MKIESGRILNDYIWPNNRQYCIPVFQRDYAWTTEQCQKLFEDIVLAYQKDRLHFCGSFVYAPLKSENHIDYYIIIDGQQRFTTLYILIKALADSATNEYERVALNDYLYNKDPFQRFGFDEKSKLKLKPVKTDNDQLQLLMNGKLDAMDKSKDGIIYHNYMLFMKLIKDFLSGDMSRTVRMIHDGINNLICADIRLDEKDDAQEIFERINSTGIVLGLPDLIRNFVLMTDKNQEQLYADYWLKMQELLPKDLITGFFLDYLNLKLDDFTKESQAYSDFKQIYRTGDYTNESMLKEIYHYAKLYSIFYNGSNQLSPEINNSLSGLRILNQSTVYMFLFSIFDDYEAGIINQQELGKILQLLLNYSIRRMTCEIPSNSLRGLYKTLYSRVFNRPENKEHYYDAIVCFLLQMTSKDVIPSDTDFILALQEKNLYRKNALCKFLLSAIENQGKEKIVTNNLTIEHIMPQNKNLSTAWQKMLGVDWETTKERYLHTLGNLTLTAYNSELGDQPFGEKKKLLEEKGSHITILYSDVKDKDTWNAGTIEARANRLADIVLRLFPIEQPKVKIGFSDPRYQLYTVADPSNATFKDVSYYELLGERVNVVSFADMVRSVALKLYNTDSTIIENMARTNEKFPTWGISAFSFDEKAFRHPFKLAKDADIYIAAGFSASDCICFIRALMKKYNLDIEEDFRYCAKSSKTADGSPDWFSLSKKWCERQGTEGKLVFDVNNSAGRYVRFTTPTLNELIPEHPEKLSPWKTPNFYFYEITNVKGKFFIQLSLYCKGITAEMKESFIHLSEIANKGELGTGYKLYFKTQAFESCEDDTEEIINSQLDAMLAEVQAFEAVVAAGWNEQSL